MLRRAIIIILFVLVVPATAVFWWAGDKHLSRPDRIRLDREKERLREVRDAILRFRMGRGRFPDDLTELVPGHLPEEMLFFVPDARSGVRRRIRWHPRTRKLQWPAPLVVRGMVTYTAHYCLTLQDVPSRLEQLEGAAADEALDQVVLGPEDIVVEAENFQFMTYGWQIDEGPDCSGGRYIYIKEGVGDHESDAKMARDRAVRSSDFHNVGGYRRQGGVRFWFMAPSEGWYHVAVRTMAQRSSCSNIHYFKMDGRELWDVGNPEWQPFVWRWHRPCVSRQIRRPAKPNGRVRLKKGLNSFCFLICQDDVKTDQVVFAADPQKLLPLYRDGQRTCTGGYRQAPELPDGFPPLTLSLTMDTLTVTADKDPEVAIYVHKNVPEAMDARLAISVDLPGGRRRDRRYDIHMEETQELVKYPCELNLPRPLEKKEYLLRCQLLIGADVVAERTLALSRSCDWSILGPLPYMPYRRAGPVERDERPRPSYAFGGLVARWRRYDDQYTDPFCLMDFARMFTGRTYYGPHNVALYAYTEVDASRGGTYLLKGMGDDDLVVWINGTRAFVINEKGPPIRSAREKAVVLKKGRNRILFRLNQVSEQWQACIRIRTPDDQVADVRGVPFDEQDVDF